MASELYSTCQKNSVYQFIIKMSTSNQGFRYEASVVFSFILTPVAWKKKDLKKAPHIENFVLPEKRKGATIQETTLKFDHFYSILTFVQKQWMAVLHPCVWAMKVQYTNKMMCPQHMLMVWL